MNTDTRQQIETALRAFSGADLRAASIGLLNTLGYVSGKTLDLDNTPDAFLAEFDKRGREFRRDKALFDRWKSVEFLFQIADDEVRSAGDRANLDFQTDFDAGNFQSYLFFALDLEKNHYTRTNLADITREINLLFDMPAMLLMRHNGALTFSIIDRRLNKKDQSRDVLKKVKLIKDIRYQHPHRAHIEILYDLSLQSLMAKHECRNFEQLHEAWRTTLDTNELNRKFYRELADWYFWALNHVEFPDDVEKDGPTRNATNVIRLLTRLIFCWFLKEKGLIPAELFSQRRLAEVLKSLEDDDSTFYLAILQNLFFGTLNQRMNTGDRENRRFANDGSFHERMNEYGVKNLYRYQRLFAIAEGEAVELFSDIPFLNGGLFDCLDKENDSEKKKVLYVDGFTRNPRKQPRVPNFLFFSDYQTIDLSDAYGDRKKKKEKVRGLINLLDSYKFTITENTPIEEEIALDPELLGKVFENLLASYNPETGTTARKQTGSFYTPREIVNYMVDESLIAYLEGQLKAKVPKLAKMKDLQDLLREVFAYTEKAHPFNEEEVDTLIDAIDQCKILDPACGSGAFPMGILHKLVFILGRLDPHNERWKRKQIAKAEEIPDVSAREIAIKAIEKDFETNDLDYGRKLYLIENCIYGVDIQPIAIQIAKLRFFISLVCDQRTNRDKARNCGVRPLPNLETKFVAANTLISLDRGQDQGILTDQRLPKLESELAAVRHRHFAAQRRRDKLALQKRDAELRGKIAAVLADGGMSEEASHQLAVWDPYDQNTSAPFFDPEWMFGITTGFDVAIGNPPYVRQEKIRHLKPLLKDEYATFTGTADLYVYFYERAIEILADGGVLSFISSNKFFRSGYGKALRAYLTRNMTLQHVIDFGDAPVFTAIAYPTVLVARKKAAQDFRLDSTFNTMTWQPGPDVADFVDIYAREGFGMRQDKLSPDGWRLESEQVLTLLDKLTKAGTPLGDYVNGRFYYGIKTGLNEAFVVDRVTRDRLIAEDPRSEEILKPFLRGRDVKRWRVDFADRYLIKIESSENKRHPWSGKSNAEEAFAATYPAIHKWFNGFRDKLIKRYDQGKYFEELRACTYWQAFEKPKVIVPAITSDTAYAVDVDGFFSNDKTSICVSDEVYFLAGILNSSACWWFIRSTAAGRQGGFYEFKPMYVMAIPIPVADKQMKSRLESLAKQAAAAEPEARVTVETEINKMVYSLYDLTPEEIAIVEGRGT